MERTQERPAMQTMGSMSLLLALVTFLAMWGGVTLLLTDPYGPRLPPFSPTLRGTMQNLLLFWTPMTPGAAAFLTGLVGLCSARRSPGLQRRAMVGILLGLAPACLAAAWLGWMLSGAVGR